MAAGGGTERGATDHGRYALTEVSEEARHSTMFGRLVNKMGVEPYTYPKFATRVIRLLGLVPLGPSGLGACCWSRRCSTAHNARP